MADAFDLAGKRIFVAGHRGMVGSAVVRRLAGEGCEVLTAARAELDLTEQSAVRDWMAAARPDAVVLAAAHVGGILANDRHPADFLYLNLMIEANVIHAAHLADVDRLLFLGSSCIYPRLAPQPIPEDALLTGPLEPTNEWYAVAKIAGIKLCQAYRRQHGRDYVSAMPTNLYGTGDNYHPENSHVLPAMIRRFDAAAREGADEVTIWGTGAPLREFMHADDCADALVFLLRRYSEDGHVNVGSGHEVSILELARLVARATGYAGTIATDPSRPDGTPRKLMDGARLQAMGWRPRIGLAEGIARTVAEFRALDAP
jgi:GDP-L-fucose synthase